MAFLINALGSFRSRFLYILIFTTIFVVIGYFAPRLLIQYGNKKYIEFVEPITFDRQLYNRCDTLKSVLKIYSEVDTKVLSHSRLLRIENKGFNPVWTKTEDTFISKTEPTSRYLQTDYKLPCETVDLKAGVYFYEGQYDYKVQGVDKVYKFISTQFTVIDEETDK